MICGIPVHDDQCECPGDPEEAAPEPIEDEPTERIPVETMADVVLRGRR